MAHRARALLAIAIVAIVAAAVALPALRVLPPPWLWLARRRGFLALYAVAVDKYGDPQLISNASFSVWAFYPTKSGTVFQGIYNGTGGLAYVNLSSLVNWAEAWISYYGPRAVYSFMPSLIVFVSYPIEVNSTTVEVVSQQFMVPLNLTEPLTKRGEVVRLNVTHPFRFYYHVGSGSAGQEYGALKAAVRPAQTTTTTTSTSITTTTIWTTTTITVSGTAYLYEGWLFFVPHVVAWYPSNSSVAPVSLVIAVARQAYYANSSSDVLVDLILLGASVTQVSFNAVAAAGGAFSSAIDDAEVGAVAQAVAALSPVIPGATLTFTLSSSAVESSNNTAAYVTPVGKWDVGQLYILGQVALVNWTIRTGYGAAVGWQVGTMLTAVQVVESGGAVAPAVYSWEAYDPCVNVTEWAQEYEAIEFGGLPPSVAWEVNQSCPIPNTPAPVDWMDYDYNLTQVAAVAPNSRYTIQYVEIEEASEPSSLGAVFDAGSAAATTAGLAAWALGAGVPVVDAAFVVAAMLNSVQVSSYEVAASVEQIITYNLIPATAYLYVSNLTPVYVEYGAVSYTLPRGLVVISTSAP